MLLDSNPHPLSAKLLDYPLGYRGIVIIFIQISNCTTILSALFTKIHEDWVKGHWIFICLGSILTNNTFTSVIYVISVLYLLCFRARLFIDALWTPTGKWLTSWLSFVMSNCDSFYFVTFPFVSWVRCGTWLYRFLIFVFFLILRNGSWVKCHGQNN